MNQTPLHIIAIAGYGRSGSTLLELLLLQNLDAASVGELKYVFQRGFVRGELCACGSPFNRCKFWRQVGSDIFQKEQTPEGFERLRRTVERHSIFFLHRILRIPSRRYQEARQLYIRVLRELVTSIRVRSGADVIIDGSKDPAHIDLLMEAFPGQVSVVHLVRDSRAVAFSFKTPKVRKEVYWTEELMGSNPPLRASIDWAWINFSLDLLIDKERRRIVTYEKLASEHLKAVRTLLDWLPVATVSSKIQSHSHSVSGNPMRFDAERIEVKLDERWKQKMRWIDSAIVTILTFPWLFKYGYLKWPSRR